MDDEERGGDGIGGVKVEKFCFRARFLPKSDGGGGEGCPHSSQVVPRKYLMIKSELTFVCQDGRAVYGSWCGASCSSTSSSTSPSPSCTGEPLHWTHRLITSSSFRAVLLNQENPECKKGDSKLEGGGCAFTLYDSNGQPQSCSVNQKPEECDERSHHRQQFEKVNL